MLILVVLILLVPAMVCVLCYEKFRGTELSWYRRAVHFLADAFFINFGTYTILWLRGWELISWTLTPDSSATMIPVVVQYMGISIVISLVLAYVLSLVRIEKTGKSGIAAEEDEGPDEVQAAETAETDNT